MWNNLQDLGKTAINYVPPLLIKFIEKWLFGCFYIIFTTVSWIFGGGLWKWILTNAIFLIGAYYVGSIIFDFISHWVVQRIESAELSRNPAIKDLMMRARYPPYSRAMYEKYKRWSICQIIVGRHPLMDNAKRCLNFFSAGAWDQVSQELFKSYVNHILLLLVLRSPDNGEVKLIRLHKTEVVAISDEYTILENTTLKNVPGVRDAALTLEQLLSVAHEENTDSFLNFRVLDNNCQKFTEFLLEKNGLLSQEMHTFIIQDLTLMVNKIPIYITPVSEFVILLIRILNYILYIK
jgi:hypothetical protein